MVNLVLSTKLITQVVTAYQIDSPRESGIAEIKTKCMWKAGSCILLKLFLKNAFLNF